jgi:hypothetical protein
MLQIIIFYVYKNSNNPYLNRKFNILKKQINPETKKTSSYKTTESEGNNDSQVLYRYFMNLIGFWFFCRDFPFDIIYRI